MAASPDKPEEEPAEKPAPAIPDDDIPMTQPDAGAESAAATATVVKKRERVEEGEAEDLAADVIEEVKKDKDAGAGDYSLADVLKPKKLRLAEGDTSAIAIQARPCTAILNCSAVMF